MDNDSGPTFPSPGDSESEQSQQSEFDDDNSDLNISDFESSDDEDDIINEDDDIAGPNDPDISDSEVDISDQKLTNDEYDSDSDDSENDEEYLRKFDSSVRERFIEEVHPQSLAHNFEEVLGLAAVTRDARGQIVDSLHRTTPVLTKYEKTRILGQRAAQINSGSKPLVQVPKGIFQGHLIAEMELEARKIPFIIRRPLPNGGSEYWRVKDLEHIC